MVSTPTQGGSQFDELAAEAEIKRLLLEYRMLSEPDVDASSGGAPASDAELGEKKVFLEKFLHSPFRMLSP